MRLTQEELDEILDKHEDFLNNRNGGQIANLEGADLSGLDFRLRTLVLANLHNAKLFGANLSASNLAGADLSYANLRAANLIGVNLSGANLVGANLEGADLRLVKCKKLFGNRYEVCEISEKPPKTFEDFLEIAKKEIDKL